MNSKRLADLITLGRAAGAVLLALWGAAHGPDTLPAAAVFLLANWTGDVLDGALARRSPHAPRTWIGDHDLEADMWVAAWLLAYLALAGLIGAGLAGGYAALWVVVLAFTGWPRALCMLCQAPVYAGLMLLAVERAPAAALWLALWPLAAILITWPRFPRRVVPEFLAGMRALQARLASRGRKV